MRTAPFGAIRAPRRGHSRRWMLLGTVLLTCSALFPGEAWPAGGTGGSSGTPAGGANSVAGAGGSGSSGNAGNRSGGGGGGAGITGGAGGMGPSSNLGGNGGSTAGAAGQNGVAGFLGGSGGGGGAHGAVLSTLPNPTGGTLTGGAGGNGGAAGNSLAGAGGGGAGGFGAVIQGDGALGTLGRALTGGAGGSSGTSIGRGGGGGRGGVGLYLSGTAPSLTLGANVTGGAGGRGGSGNSAGAGGDAIFSGTGLTLVIQPGVSVTGGAGATGGVASAQGHGIVGSAMQITNAGTITGLDALRFEGGTNSLALAAGSVITGNINLRNASALTITPDAAGSTLSAPLIGDGALTKAGAGTLILTGANSLTGGTIIQAGRLQIGAGGTQGTLAGAIVNNATLAFSRSDNIALTNAISGSGALVQAGPGRLTLQGALTYTGETRVEGGTLALTQTDLLTSGGSAFHVAAGATLDLGSVAGSGALAMGALTGGGNLVTAAAARQLSLGGSGSFAGVISGGAELAVTNGAMVELSGVNSYTGLTRVEQGATLRVNGSIASSRALDVTSGTVGGSGTLPGVSLGAQGRLAPGNSIGTLTVQGDLAMQAGSALVMEVRGEAADRVNISGTARLSGEVQLVPLGGAYRFNAPYTLLQAASVTGSPALVTRGSFGAGVTVALNLGATTMQLVLTPAILVASPAPEEPAAAPPDPPAEPAPPAPAPETPRVVISPGLGLPGALPSNLRATAAALDRANRAGADLSPFFNVYNQAADSIGAAVNQLSGEVATGTAAMGFTSGSQFLATMLDPQGQGREGMGGRLWLGGDGDDEPAPRRSHAVWGMAMGAYARAGGDAGEGVAARTARMAGFAIGLDYRLGPQSMAGLALSVGESRASLAGGLGGSQANFGQVGAYGMTRLGGLTLSGAAALTWLEVESRRSLAALGGDTQRANFGVLAQSVRGEVRQDGVALGGFRLQPLAALQWQQMDNQSYAESSPVTGRLLGVAVGAQSQSSLRIEAGAQLEGVVSLGGRAVQAQLRAAWAHYALRDAAMAVGFAALPNSGFILRGARQDANAALLSAGVEVPVAPGVMLGARLDGELSSHFVQLAGLARLRYLF